MHYLLIAALMFTAFTFSAIADDEMANHIAAAKAVEEEYHALCDKWAAASERGESTTDIEQAIPKAHSRFVREVLQTKYIPNAAIPYRKTFVGAGQFTLDNGTTYSYVISGDTRDLTMWVWARKEWTADSIPDHGYAGSLSLAANEGLGPLKIGKATRQGIGSKTVFVVPYTLKDFSGAVQFRVADSSVRPDRGTVDQSHVWHPNSAATRDARQ